MKKKGPLFNIPEPWEKEWKDMPEFQQKEMMPFRTISVHFEKQEDIEIFSNLIGQKINSKTKSIWFPKIDILKTAHKRYVDES